MNAPTPLPAVRTTCPYCGVGCGVLATPDGLGGAAIAGDSAHPANFGRLCSKGAALGETLALETRLLHPMLRQADGAMATALWSEALDRVADGFARTVREHGPDAVAFYLSGQLLTEDYYVANKLMKGFIGSGNVDTNSRLCMASSVAGHRRAFGADTVPGVYADLDDASLIVLVGSNAAWCHPVLYQRMLENKRRTGARIVVIDPRRTASAEDADLFLPIAPGMDAALFAGLLVHLADAGVLDYGYINDCTGGFAGALAQARALAPDAASTAQTTGLSESAVADFFAMFAANERAVTCYSQGVNQSAQGTDKVNAIINCHLATGRIGKPGAGPFSLTGQPNAMGGREVGGLANQLAAHMGFTPEDIDRVRRFWRAPRMAEREGLKAVPMFEAIARGEIKALWVLGTNPAVSLPRADAMRTALGMLDLFVVSENVRHNDTVAAHAHVLLPAAAWGEKDGTVTNSERRISRQRPFLPPAGEAKPDWWAIAEVARRMGFADAFSFEGPGAIFREHAALSAFENRGHRDFDIGGLADADDDAYDRLEPTQWPVRHRSDIGDSRFFAAGGFFTANGKGRFVPIPAARLRGATSEAFPFRLNTGRIRDQWHTMTRSGLSPRLGAHRPEPFVEVHPDDAITHSLDDGGFARVTTEHGACVLRVVVTASQRRGSLFAPIHWSDATASAARINALVAPHTDALSGQPEAKATPAAIAPHRYALHGFLLVQAPLGLPTGTLWSKVAVGGGVGYLIASDADVATWRTFAETLAPATSEIAAYADARRKTYRFAAFDDGRLAASLFVGPVSTALDWSSVKVLMHAAALAEPQRRALLSGRSTDGLPQRGPLVCACFGVGRAAIESAVSSGAATTVEAIKTHLRAGSNCGSCLPEIKRIVAKATVSEAAV